MKYSTKAKLPGIVGCILMILVILVCVPFTIPRIFGIEIYRVLTESMEPDYPKGSLVYIKSLEASELEAGDVVTYHLGTNTDLTQTHRIISIDRDAETLITKGDANDAEDKAPIPFSQVIGKPVLCLPRLANVYAFARSTVGILLTIMIFAFSMLCFLLSELWKKMEVQGEKTGEYPNRNKKSSSKGILFAAILFILAAAVILAIYLYPYLSADARYQQLEAKYTDFAEDAGDGEEDTIDGEGLAEENPEIIGWIRVDGTTISYPLVQTSDNTTYLNKAADGSRSKLGAIFLNTYNSPDFSDLYTIIYGHNTKNGKMFGPLNNYSDVSFFEAHQYITIITSEAEYRYQIFSAHVAEPDDEVFSYGFAADSIFAEFLERITARSLYNTDISVTKDDHILTLSTCVPDDDVDQRFVVHAVRLED